MNPKAWLSSVAAVLASIVVIIGFWGDFGWKIRKDYDAEHIDVPTTKQILSEIQASKELTTKYHTHWECDEFYEEILDLRMKQADLNPSTLALVVELNMQLETLQKKFDDKDCVNFVD